jgi:hypothetical protein
MPYGIALPTVSDGKADPKLVQREQFGGQHVRALARPAQRGLRVTACHRIDELLTGRPHLGMRRLERSLAVAAPNLDDVARHRTGAGLVRPLRTVLIAMPGARATAATPP